MGGAHTVTLANVLNVIPTAKGRGMAVRLALLYLRPGGTIYVSVYEGDRTGKGKRTRDGWQANRRLASYVKGIERALRGAPLPLEVKLTPNKIIIRWT